VDYRNNNGSYDDADNEANNQPETNTSHDESNDIDSVDNNNRENSNRQEAAARGKRPKKKRSWGSGILGGVIGGVIAALIVSLIFTVAMPTNTASDSGQPPASQQTSNYVDQVSSDGASEASTIAEAAESVVGVVNVQQPNIWMEGQQTGTGSGIIYKKQDGQAYIVTNHHVVAGADQVEIVLNDETRLEAQVLGSDQLSDLAVLQVDGSEIDTVANIGSSSDMQIGETVMAIGNPLGLSFSNTVTQGIVSGLNRSVNVDTNQDGQPDWVTEVIQTDAAINPGNSGGALVNAEGEVVGINSMKVAQQAVEGMGFAIPIDQAMPIIQQLEQNGQMERPAIGVSVAPLAALPLESRLYMDVPLELQHGVAVAQVQSGSPAEDAGLQQYDIITQIDGTEVSNIVDIRQVLYTNNQIGETVEVEYYRDGNVETTELKLEAPPEGQQQQQQSGGQQQPPEFPDFPQLPQQHEPA